MARNSKPTTGHFSASDFVSRTAHTMSIATKLALTLLALTSMFFSSCASTGAHTAPFESNASFKLMLYG